LALVVLSIVPILGGVARLLHVSGDAAQNPEHARFAHSPVPIVVHVIVVTLFSVLGAFQFSHGVRLRWPVWHRRAGRVLAVSGLIGAISGLWMTLFYRIPEPMQGDLLYWVRILVGTAMAVCIVIAWSSILRRNVPRHEAFMIRAYALGQGAGTQVVILLPWMLITGNSLGFTRDVLMTLSWVVNAVIAEWIIARRSRPRRGRTGALRPASAGV
jgi:hypothetical protein